MAIDKAVDSAQLDAQFSAIANAIRAKNGSQSTYTPAQMPAAIAAIPAGSAPRLPAAYQEVEYIQTDGAAYIDTGYVFSGAAQIEIKVYRASTERWNFFGADDANNARFSFEAAAKNNIISFEGSHGSNRLTVSFSYPIQTSGNAFTIHAKSFPNKLLLIDTDYMLYGNNNTSIGTPLTRSSYLLAQNHYDGIRITAETRCYYCKIWDGQDKTLVRDFVPCYRKADGVIGMYDLANDLFYQNAAGTGAFSKGPDV